MATVDMPGGERVEFSYDPLGRRVEARRYEAARLHERTRFVWDGDTLAHAIRTRAVSEGDPIVEERLRAAAAVMLGHASLGVVVAAVAARAVGGA